MPWKLSISLCTSEQVKEILKSKLIMWMLLHMQSSLCHIFLGPPKKLKKISWTNLLSTSAPTKYISQQMVLAASALVSLATKAFVGLSNDLDHLDYL